MLYFAHGKLSRAGKKSLCREVGLLPVFLLLFACLFLGVLIQGVAQFVQNERAPVVTEPARLVRKVANTHTDAGGGVQETLTLVFALESGELRCCVSGRVYRAVPEGSAGLLTHQGTRFRRFDFGRRTVEK